MKNHIIGTTKNQNVSTWSWRKYRNFYICWCSTILFCQWRINTSKNRQGTRHSMWAKNIWNRLWNIFMLNLKYQDPIGDSIKAESLSLVRDYEIRDCWMLGCLTKMLRSTVPVLVRKRCRGNSLLHTNWLRILTSYKLDTMTPFSINTDGEKFMLSIGENLVVYKY